MLHHSALALLELNLSYSYKKTQSPRQIKETANDKQYLQQHEMDLSLPQNTTNCIFFDKDLIFFVLVSSSNY